MEVHWYILLLLVSLCHEFLQALSGIQLSKEFFFFFCLRARLDALETTGEIREPSWSQSYKENKLWVTKSLEPCRHWGGRESALRRLRCYCRLGGSKSRTNRPTTCRVERLSSVASLSCLVSMWNFYIWCDPDVEIAISSTLTLNSTVT